MGKWYCFQLYPRDIWQNVGIKPPAGKNEPRRGKTTQKDDKKRFEKSKLKAGELASPICETLKQRSLKQWKI